MIEFSNIDLGRDAAARSYVKDEVVDVVFAVAAGELISREGPNRYAAGDALVTGSTGDRWSVSRSRFDAKYVAVPPLRQGSDGRYSARPVPVLAGFQLMLLLSSIILSLAAVVFINHASSG